MDITGPSISWSSSEASALLAALGPPTPVLQDPPTPTELPLRARPGVKLQKRVVGACSLTPPPIPEHLKVRLLPRRSPGQRPCRKARIYPWVPGNRSSPLLGAIKPAKPPHRPLPNRGLPEESEDRRTSSGVPSPIKDPTPTPLAPVLTSEDRRTVQNLGQPFLQPAPVLSDNDPARTSEDRRTVQDPGRSILSLAPASPSDDPAQASEDRRTAQDRERPSLPDLSCLEDGTPLASEDRRTALGPCHRGILPNPSVSKSPSGLDRGLPTKPAPWTSPDGSHSTGSSTPPVPPPTSPPAPTQPTLHDYPAASSDPVDDPSAAPGAKAKRRTRRAGRKNQLRRLWNSYRGLDLSIAPGVPSPIFQPTPPPVPTRVPAATSSANGPNAPAPEPPRGRGTSPKAAPTRPRITSNIPYRGPRILRWRLTPIRLGKPVYPANIPARDPRRETYLRKRANVLYPLPDLS